MLGSQSWDEVLVVPTRLCSIVEDGKKYDLLPPISVPFLKDKVRFVPTTSCSIVKDGKKYDLLPPIRVRFPRMARSTICCHQFVFDCRRWKEVRLVAIVATNLSIVKDGKKYDLLPPIRVRFPKMGRSTICCHQFVFDCQGWEEVRFVATNSCSIPKDGKNTICCEQFVSIVEDGKKYDLLPPLSVPFLKDKVRFVPTTSCSIVQDGKKYDLLPPIRVRFPKMARSTICCHQFVFDCRRWKEVRLVAIVATNLSIVEDGRNYDLLPPISVPMLKDGKKHDLFPPVCVRLSKMGRSTICCHQFVFDCQQWEEVRLLRPVRVYCPRWEEARLVATSLCLTVKDGKKYDLLPQVCA